MMKNLTLDEIEAVNGAALPILIVAAIEGATWGAALYLAVKTAVDD